MQFATVLPQMENFLLGLLPRVRGEGSEGFPLARCENLLAFDLSVIPCQIDWKTGRDATT